MKKDNNISQLTMPRLLTLKDLAKWLGMHYSSLYHMLPRITEADGKMRVGGGWRFDAMLVEQRMRAGGSNSKVRVKRWRAELC
jgi:hypothetical protein